MKNLKKLGVHAFISEGIAKGFPDLLVSIPGFANFFIELKLCGDTERENHIKAFARMQLYLLAKLTNAFGLVFIPSKSAVLYCVVSTQRGFDLLRLGTINNARELVEKLKSVAAGKADI